MSDQQIWRNPVRERLEAGQPAIGVTITTASVEAAAHASTLGFHFLWIEMEHSPVTLETLRLMVLATRGRPAAVFARVPVVELWTAKRVLDQGVSGVIFPFAALAERPRELRPPAATLLTANVDREPGRRFAPGRSPGITTTRPTRRS